MRIYGIYAGWQICGRETTSAWRYERSLVCIFTERGIKIYIKWLTTIPKKT